MSWLFLFRRNLLTNVIARTVPELPSATSKTGSSGSQDDISPEPDPLLPLPSVPGVQTPRWLNRNEGMVYLTPLYQRGWYVSTEPLPDGKRRTAFTLKKIFKLRKRVWCASFMKEVADTMVALKVCHASASSRQADIIACTILARRDASSRHSFTYRGISYT